MEYQRLSDLNTPHPPGVPEWVNRFSSFKEKFLPVLGGIVVSIIVLTGCGDGSSEKSNASGNSPDSTAFRADTVAVDVATVQTKDFVRTLSTTGTLNAQEKATVRAKVEGEVQNVYVDIGDEVNRGKTLLKIDPTDYKLALQQAQAQLAQAKAKRDAAEREKKRMTGLYEAGSATEQNKDRAATDYQQAQAAYQQALATKNIAEQKVDYTSIEAPFGGVVTKRFYKKGDYAAAGQPAAEVTDLAVLEAEMNLPEQYAGSVHKGLPVTLSFQSRIDSTQGKVLAVNPQIDTDSRTFLVKVTVNNRNHSLSDGLFFNAIFTLPALKNKPAVPTAAVQKDGGEDILWIIKNGKAHRRSITRGPENGDWVMIKRGAEPGQTVAVGGTGSLIDGYPVTTNKVDSLTIRN